MATRVDPEARKREIAMKAMGLFSKVGFDNVSLQMVAGAAGVARTVIYRHFRNKREVLDEAIHEATRYIMVECGKLLEGPGMTAQKLQSVCHRTAEILFGNKDFLVAVYDFVVAEVRVGTDMTGRVKQFTTGIRNLFVSLLEKGKSDGEFRETVDPLRTADILYSFLEVCTMRIILGTERTPAEAKRRFTALVESLAEDGRPTRSDKKEKTRR